MGRRPERQARWRNTTATGPVVAGEHHELQLLRQLGFERIEALSEKNGLGPAWPAFSAAPLHCGLGRGFHCGEIEGGTAQKRGLILGLSSRMLHRHSFC